MFIETVNKDNCRLNKSPGTVFNVEIKCWKNKSSRIQINLLDRKDGTFIVRYKLYNPCSKLFISIKCSGKELLNFPHQFQGISFPNECSCIIYNNVEDWLNAYNCPKISEQIVSDLKPFSSINFEEILPTAQQTLFNDPHKSSVCNYVVKNNQIYRICYGQYVGFKMFVDAILLSLTRKLVLPDLEILVNLGD